jgi:3-deoxy-manno-octulosonate cytidylyltransferase (CMP-KDO synthetase)
MSVHVVIPARLASTRLPRKPLVPISGVPMIVRVARQALLADVDDVTVAVDADEVLSVVEAAGLRAVLTDPGHPSGSDRVFEVAEKSGWDDADIVVNVQGDEPLLPPNVIDALVAAMHQRPDTAMGTVSEPIRRIEEFLDPNAVKVVTDAHDQALYFSRAPIPYPRDEMSNQAPADSGIKDLLAASVVQRHVGMYAFRVSGLREFVGLTKSTLEPIEKLEQLRWLEAGHRLYVLAQDEPVPGGVDTPEDLARVEAILQGG